MSDTGGMMGAMTDPGPEVDDRHPADVVTGAVAHVLTVAETWPRWDGRPVEVPVDGHHHPSRPGRVHRRGPR
jgi:hypothetical protein